MSRSHRFQLVCNFFQLFERESILGNPFFQHQFPFDLFEIVESLVHRLLQIFAILRLLNVFHHLIQAFTGAMCGIGSTS